MKKIFLFLAVLVTIIVSPFALAVGEEAASETDETQVDEETAPNYLEAVISTEEGTEIQKSTIFDASQSFLPDPTREVIYDWDFGDGNRNEGVEVLHAYKEPGIYTVTLKINDGVETSETQTQVFAYEKLIVIITDVEQERDRLEVITSAYAEKSGVYLKIIESYGSSTEFISEEVLAKRLTEDSSILQKAQQILVWTEENAGLNALSRYIQNNKINFSQKSIIILTDNISNSISRIERQYNLINAKNIIVIKEGALTELIDSQDNEQFLTTLKEQGHEFELITEKSGKLRPWNFMSYFVNYLINQGIPDNTIALLLLLPVIATVVVFMKQVVGMTTFGIYTPSIITLSFLVIGIYVGLITLLAAILIGTIAKPMMKKVRILFIPTMAIIITIAALMLFLILITSNYLGLFDAAFLSLAIFPMLILSTLVEKFVSVKTEKGFSSAIMLMTQTVIVAIIAYFIAGGKIDIGVASFRFEFIKRTMLNYPEIVFLFLVIDVVLGKWSGLRILERIRFREVLRHIEE